MQLLDLSLVFLRKMKETPKNSFREYPSESFSKSNFRANKNYHLAYLGF